MSTAAETKASQVQESILDAADECFVRFGVAKTTMDDVARSAGLSRASVYRYFSDRESLIVASVQRRARANVARVRAELVKVESFAARLETGICRDVRRGKRDPVLHSLVSVNEMALADRLLGHDGVGFSLTRELWEPILQDAKRSGELRAGVDPVELCAWIAQLEIMFIAQYDDDAESLRRMRKMIRRFVVPAVVA